MVDNYREGEVDTRLNVVEEDVEKLKNKVKNDHEPRLSRLERLIEQAKGGAIATAIILGVAFGQLGIVDFVLDIILSII